MNNVFVGKSVEVHEYNELEFSILLDAYNSTSFHGIRELVDEIWNSVDSSFHGIFDLRIHFQPSQMRINSAHSKTVDLLCYRPAHTNTTSHCNYLTTIVD